METELFLDQPALPGFCALSDAVNELAHSSGIEERGAIFTRKEVVDFVLDLVDYVPSRALQNRSLLEPSFGGGDFLLPAIDRLLDSWQRAQRNGTPSPSLDNCIRAVELHKPTFDRTRSAVLARLCQEGLDPGEAERLASLWLVQGDFLLARLPTEFDFVIGNPPYVRQELIPAPLLQEYRKRFPTLYDRADLYVPFIEKSLNLLKQGGQLSFICADRWTKNRYGAPLRALVASQFRLRAYIDMVDTPAFHSDVIAYPAITVIERALSGPTYVAERPDLSPSSLKLLAKALSGKTKSEHPGVYRLDGVTNGAEPWLLNRSTLTDLVRRIESNYPTLEQAGCKVGIGVATGADQAYIGKFADLDVEEDRKLPLVMTRDILTGRVEWRGYGVINPFTDEGPLVDLKAYPRLAAYLEARRETITARHVARKDSTRWFRTIDRITPSLSQRPKLLIPDIKGKAQVVYEADGLYPHHNLYFVTSDAWELRALQAVLLSGLTRLFIATYSTKMRGGFLRFQAQYLRRIRLPHWDSVPDTMRKKLFEAGENLDMDASNSAVADLYNLTQAERVALALA
ncbi:Eco57I restriction-modification methylase domain-containing protein [Polaromonas sp. YR568]|uniref:Eco57I restriction-modification methylase domain-containing protein n=1 Tax=Polaromonas sp. YR568 TaxID=1855301 RepID=UPI00398BC7FC